MKFVFPSYVSGIAILATTVFYHQSLLKRPNQQAVMASKITSSGYIESAGAKLYFEREGNPQGRSILFIHGLGGTTNAYQILVSDLQDFDIVRFDWAGHGRSSTPSSTSISSYVKDCEGQLDRTHLGIPPLTRVQL